MNASGLTEVAVEAAEGAGRLIREAFGSSVQPRRKGEVDLVTDVDRAAEASIVGRIESAYPDHEILAEESGLRQSGSACRWIIDPLDGTTNFVHGFPHVAVSVAVEISGQIEVGVVHDPLRRETFVARRECPATMNGRRLEASPTTSLRDCLVGTGFPYDRQQRADAYLRPVRAILESTRGIRRTGSAALDLAYVAAGRLDAFWEWKLQPWDVAAGALLVRQAGGTVTTISGADHQITDAGIVASNGRVHPALLEVLRRSPSPA